VLRNRSNRVAKPNLLFVGFDEVPHKSSFRTNRCTNHKQNQPINKVFRPIDQDGGSSDGSRVMDQDDGSRPRRWRRCDDATRRYQEGFKTRWARRNQDVGWLVMLMMMSKTWSNVEEQGSLAGSQQSEISSKQLGRADP
jgi:hypothetical protein